MKRETATPRPKEVTELIRTLNPSVPYRDFESARQPDCLEAILQYIYSLEGERHTSSAQQAKQIGALQSAETKLARYMDVHGPKAPGSLKDTYVGGLAAEYEASLEVIRAAIGNATTPAPTRQRKMTTGIKTMTNTSEAPERIWVWQKYRSWDEMFCSGEEIKQSEFAVPVVEYVRADNGLDVETIASLMYEAVNPGMQWSSLYPSHNHLHASVRQRFIDAAARFQDLWPYRTAPVDINSIAPRAREVVDELRKYSQDFRDRISDIDPINYAIDLIIDLSKAATETTAPHSNAR